MTNDQMQANENIMNAYEERRCRGRYDDDELEAEDAEEQMCSAEYLVDR